MRVDLAPNEAQDDTYAFVRVPLFPVPPRVITPSSHRARLSQTMLLGKSLPQPTDRAQPPVM